ncbi:hypothetical protein [Rhodopirellula sp. SWK7]|uniref:hypothetical protein n=1 Tax=Rhodopirellula sp. SWK7 TaxID=595460 RepID=UPI0002BD3C89|nr:hypothetical protein [Rhodopirellula sp. SWK7]EMI41673.1 hypothetical protein RRSWK_05845 [Rhodopirellula sp. SWK7]
MVRAIGFQTEIADRIIAEKAHCSLAVEGNPATLHEGPESFLLKHLEDSFREIEMRRFMSDEKVVRT